MNYFKKNKVLVLIVLVAFLLMSPQIYYRSIIVGPDWWFHWSRFYEAAMQISNGHFNYFQSIYAYNQTGRIINAMYGSDFAYLHGILLLIVKNWFKAELITSFLCIVVSGLSMYSLSRYCKLDRIIAVTNAIFLMGTTTIIFYISSQGFPGWATAFLPIAFIPAIRMISKDEKQINPIFLGGSVALLISIHTFTTLMYVIALIPFWCIGFYKSKSKLLMFRDSILSVLVALILAGNMIIGILDVKTTSLIMPFKVYDLIGTSMVLSDKTMGRYDYGLIFSFIFLFQFAVNIMNWKKISLLEKTIMFTGGLFLLISTKYFPWNEFLSHFPSLGGLQFPQRFSAIASVLLILNSGLVIKRIINQTSKENAKIIMAVFLVLSLINVSSGYSDMLSKAASWKTDKLDLAGDRLETQPEVIRSNFSSSDLTKAFNTIRKSTTDYLPNNGATDAPYKEYTNQIYDNPIKVKKSITEKNELQLTWEVKKSEKVQLPVFVYEHSTVELNGKKLNSKDYTSSNIGALIVNVKPGKNTIIVGYKPSFLFKFLLVLKIIAVPLTIVYCLSYTYRMNKKEKNKKNLAHH